MPRVNVKYKFVKDATIDTIIKIEFEGVVAKYKEHRIAPNKYKGKVKNVPVTKDLNIEIELSGFRGAGWTLEEVSVTKIQKSGTDPEGNPIYVEVGDPIKIKPSPITGTIGSGNVGYYNQSHDIAWK